MYIKTTTLLYFCAPIYCVFISLFHLTNGDTLTRWRKRMSMKLFSCADTFPTLPDFSYYVIWMWIRQMLLVAMYFCVRSDHSKKKPINYFLCIESLSTWVNLLGSLSPNILKKNCTWNCSQCFCVFLLIYRQEAPLGKCKTVFYPRISFWKILA